MIAIIDYGVGNLRSVQKALEYLGFETQITAEVEKVGAAKAIILPGVGAFPDAMRSLRELKMDSVILEAARVDKPVLGICLGMQLLFDKGYEIEECSGLGLISGSIRKLKNGVKIPHMGWNSLKKHGYCPLLEGIADDSYAYFVHSYYADLNENNALKASTDYGQRVPAVVSKANIYGIQFHPEKSGSTGMQILKNFGELIK